MSPSESASPGAAPHADPVLADALRADLTDGGLTVPAVETLLGPTASGALHREEILPALRAVGGRGAVDPLVTLTRVFVLGRPVPRAEAERALPRLGVEGAVRLGLLDAAGQQETDQVRPLVDLRPYSASDAAGEVDWWLASDLGEAVTGEVLHREHVLGVGGASITLAQSTIRTRVHRTLDLGTGCGVQALHASRHSDSVVATDLSARALAFARLNAALVGVELDLRLGSMLEPVHGEQFDLVVSNPPFVITPRSAGSGPVYEYRDGGRSGDDLVRDLITGVGDVLAPGGVAQLLGNWEHRGGQDWTERVGGWLDQAGLDGWVVQREVLDPAEYAELWLRDGGTTRERDRARWESGLTAWLEDFEQRGVDAVGLGMVVLRRPLAGGPSMRRLEEQPGAVRQPLGGHLATVLAAHDWLTLHDDEAVLGSRLTVAPDVTEERHLRPGAADPSVVLLRQGGGFGRTVQVGTALAGLVGACDGDLTVGQILGGLGAILDVEVAELRSSLLPAVRGLLLDGLLEPPIHR
ncbi:methyltransferase [Actinotalea sp.]|uniref:DUF7059 domain-containing protein n=1 Tax=Actinotalea sp. TaxID=1872145 RepID=UPI0035648898